MCVLKRAKVICFPSSLRHFTNLNEQKTERPENFHRGLEKVRIKHKSSEFCHYCGLGPMVRNVNFCIGSTAQLNTQTSSQTLPLSHNATACAQVSIQLGDLFFLKMKVWLLLAETWQASAGTAIPTVMVQHDCGNRSANSIGLWDWEQSRWD